MTGSTIPRRDADASARHAGGPSCTNQASWLSLHGRRNDPHDPGSHLTVMRRFRRDRSPMPIGAIGRGVSRPAFSPQDPGRGGPVAGERSLEGWSRATRSRRRLLSPPSRPDSSCRSSSPRAKATTPRGPSPPRPLPRQPRPSAAPRGSRCRVLERSCRPVDWRSDVQGVALAPWRADREPAPCRRTRSGRQRNRRLVLGLADADGEAPAVRRGVVAARAARNSRRRRHRTPRRWRPRSCAGWPRLPS